MSDIFLSYARKDLEAVRPLAELLEQQRQSPEGNLRLQERRPHVGA